MEGASGSHKLVSLWEGIVECAVFYRRVISFRETTQTHLDAFSLAIDYFIIISG